MLQFWAVTCHSSPIVNLKPKYTSLTLELCTKWFHFEHGAGSSITSGLLSLLSHPANRPVPISQNSYLAPRLTGIKQKELPRGSEMNISFLLFYSPKPRCQVWILRYRNWSIVIPTNWTQLLWILCYFKLKTISLGFSLQSFTTGPLQLSHHMNYSS